MPPSALGAHLPIRGGLAGAVREARRIGATALQVFTAAPAIWKAKPVTDEVAAAFREARAEAGGMPVVVHDSYLINLAGATGELRERSYAAFAAELDRCARYGVELVNSHMGSHVGQGVEAGVRLVGEATTRLLAHSDPSLTILMETTAGKGSSLGGTFEELAAMLHAAHGDPRLGVCLDTCHVWDAGYDLGSPEAVRATLDEFDAVVGLERLKAIHLNESRNPRGSRRDRHANLLSGEIGLLGLEAFATDPRLAHVPMILETPHEGDGHVRNLEWLRGVRAA